ncbi:hypothetical protein GALMADRAFT_233668 [Galerina marginata CBS 339.88]|uniref:N-alpha-acetyltransferase 40 n=1 Tax=Galerina marginata (strain CBS 339.88) TaxID=685588 RepID=A0A067TRX4_GALM3|nr:hypothetical protein GALMADRAFT_233668 [Galerina marginata CBS 339.88]
MPASRAVKLANKASSARLASLVSSTYELPSITLRVQVLHSNDLKQNQRDSIWAIFEANMYELYKNSSFGWDPVAKRKELFNSLSRFILLYQTDTRTLEAFTMFRFEDEEDEDVIYCYDLQVTAFFQGMGLGKKMLSELGKLGQTFYMEKIMLTVLKGNMKAALFYKATGFSMDPSSPDYLESDDEFEGDEISEEVDYEILSKKV